MKDRADMRAPPAAVGWYGIICGDGEGESWIDAVYWNGVVWRNSVKLAYARSAMPFDTREAAIEWAHEQTD